MFLRNNVDIPSLNNVYYYCLWHDKGGTCIYLVDAFNLISFLIPIYIFLIDSAYENEHQYDAQNLIPIYNLTNVKFVRRLYNFAFFVV